MTAATKKPQRSKLKPARQDIERLEGEDLERFLSRKLPDFEDQLPDETPMPLDDGDLEFEP